MRCHCDIQTQDYCVPDRLNLLRRAAASGQKRTNTSRMWVVPHGLSRAAAQVLSLFNQAGIPERQPASMSE
jgi:hypothetical protein